MIAAAISGCASNPEVQKIGKDTYTITVDEPDSGGAAEAKRMALSNAQAFCTSKDKSFAFLRTFTPVSYFSDEARRIHVLDFRCLDESDPEYKNMVIEQTPEIRVEADAR